MILTVCCRLHGGQSLGKSGAPQPNGGFARAARRLALLFSLSWFPCLLPSALAADCSVNPINVSTPTVYTGHDALCSAQAIATRSNVTVNPGIQVRFVAPEVRLGAGLQTLANSDFLASTDTSVLDLSLPDFSYPDGIIGHVYSQALQPATGRKPYTFSLQSGALPDGLELNSATGLIQGTPTQTENGQFTLRVTDVLGDYLDASYNIRVFGILTVGEHGTFQDCNGLQMALNQMQDLYEIRIEKGIYSCINLQLPSNKVIDAGIKISGGWNEDFSQQTLDPALTLFDPRYVAEYTAEGDCTDAGHVWTEGACFLTSSPSGRILNLQQGPVDLAGLTFRNASGYEAVYSAQHLTIDRSEFHGNSKVAVYAYSNLTVADSVFSENKSSSGSYGAIYTQGTLNMSRSTLSNNSSPYYGGAIYAGDNVEVSYSHFSKNNTSHSYGGYGGAIYARDNVEVSYSHFSDNSSSGNGGAINAGDDAVISHSHFSNNSAGSDGGAIRSDNIRIDNSEFNGNSTSSGAGGAIFSSRFSGRIEASKFVGNSSGGSGGSGGAVYVYSSHSSPVIIDSYFEANNAGNDGGALFNRNNAARVIGSTFVNNTASNIGGAVWNVYSINNLYANNQANYGGAAYSSTLINDTLVANEATTAGGGFYGSSSILNSLFYDNLADGSSNDIASTGALTVDYSLFNYASGVFDYAPHNITGDPKFVDPANGDYRLSFDSPAIDSGDSALLETYTYPQDDLGNPLDLDGKARLNGDTVDIGAYEY